MTGLHGKGHHPTQVLWQIMEVAMNGWLLYAVVTAGLTLPLILWTVAEVGMNSWLLLTMLQMRKKIASEPIRTLPKSTTGRLGTWTACSLCPDSGERESTRELCQNHEA